MDTTSVTELSHKRAAQEAVELLTNRLTLQRPRNQQWYIQGVDFCFYAPAQDACLISKQRLQSLRLEDGEARLLREAVRPEDILDKLSNIQQDQEAREALNSPVMKRASAFVNSFSVFADRIAQMVLVMVPQSPEYTVTIGMMCILFKAVVAKKEKEESLMNHIGSIASRLPVIDFYQNVFPTDALKASVARIYAHIMKLLDEAIVYYRSWRLIKLVDAVIRTKSKFHVHVENIESELQILLGLKDMGHIAQTSDMLDMVSETGLLMARMYEDFQTRSNAIGMSMEMINSKLDTLMKGSSSMLHFEKIKHAHALQELILPGGRDAEEELETVVQAGFNLSQKDHWENNGVLDMLLVWSTTGHNFLWVGGDSGNQDSWVTEMAADLIRALQLQSVTALHVFCKQPRREPLTPAALVRSLLVQLLDLHPDLPYQRPELCSDRRFRQAVTFRQLWRIFEQLAAGVPGLFVVVDRVEECEADEEASVVEHLLPALVGLASGSSEVKVVATSICVQPKELAALPVSSLYIDTSRRLKRR